MKKFTPDKPKNLRTVFEKWLYALKFGELYVMEESSLPEELATEEGIVMAIQELRKINGDRELRQILEARSKEAHTRATIIADAEQRGELNARKTLAKRMLALNLSLDQVSELTGFTPEELKVL